MKADAKPTLEEVASLLCKGKPVPDWIVPRLRKHRELIGLGVTIKIDPTDDEFDRKLLESAKQLEEWLGKTASLYMRLAEHKAKLGKAKSIAEARKLLPKAKPRGARQTPPPPPGDVDRILREHGFGQVDVGR